jgi:hypothetical protein
MDDHEDASDGREADSDESRPTDGVDVDEQVDVLEHGCGLLEVMPCFRAFAAAFSSSHSKSP